MKTSKSATILIRDFHRDFLRHFCRLGPALVLIGVLLGTGCGVSEPIETASNKKLSKRVKRPKRKPRTKTNTTKPTKPRRRGLGLSSDGPTRRVLPDVTAEPGATQEQRNGTAPARTYTSAREKLDEAATIIKQSIEYGPTLAVWILDRSPSASQMTSETIAKAQEFYGGLKESEQAELTTAIVAFGDQVDFVLEEPTSDPKKVLEAFQLVTSDSGFREQAFLAAKKALEKYMTVKTKERKEVLFLVVTDESGDDAGMVESLIDKPRKYGLPFYVVGPAATFGRASAMDQSAERPRDQTNSSMTYVRNGPESRYPERVVLDFTTGNYEGEDLDSGFGPFAWEWLCRESGGRHLTIHTKPMGFGAPASSSNYPYSQESMKKLEPHYISESEYRKQLDSNKACMAVHHAATRRRVEALAAPMVQFEKKSEAELKRSIDAAQTDAARLEPALLQLHEILKDGESDRNKLTNPRWQANFDLAIGRTLAALVRVRGYNSMLAVIERGKQFTNKESTTWVLQPADSMDEAGSTLRRQAEKAKMYLNRVIKEHPDTPWAILAKKELETPIGWKWTEL